MLLGPRSRDQFNPKPNMGRFLGRGSVLMLGLSSQKISPEKERNLWKPLKKRRFFRRFCFLATLKCINWVSPVFFVSRQKRTFAPQNNRSNALQKPAVWIRMWPYGYLYGKNWHRKQKLRPGWHWQKPSRLPCNIGFHLRRQRDRETHPPQKHRNGKNPPPR